jgi:ankyrin repeat protein
MQIKLNSVCAFFLLNSFTSLSFASDIADAAMQQNLEAIEKLIATGVDVNEQQADGATALHWAVQWDDLAAAELLLAAGASPDTSNRTGATPLRLAAINGNAAMLSLLLKSGADVNEPLSTTGDTAL